MYVYGRIEFGWLLSGLIIPAQGAFGIRARGVGQGFGMEDTYLDVAIEATPISFTGLREVSHTAL